MGLEQLTYTCRNKIGSNINLILPNAVGRLKVNWKQLIWMVRHGLKHKNTDSNIRATKFQSRIRKHQVISNNRLNALINRSENKYRGKYENIEIGNKNTTVRLVILSLVSNNIGWIKSIGK